MTLRRLVRQGRRVPGLLEVAAQLSAATLRVLVTPDRRLPRLLGEPVAGSPGIAAVSPRCGLGRDIAAVAGRLPWHPRCLVQAIAAQRLLNRRGFPAVVHLAVVPGSKLEAHAWVTTNDRPVVGQGALTADHVHLASYSRDRSWSGPA